jgi:hypothetical protein
MTLTEFLLARIAEDEEMAESAASHNGGTVFARDNYGCLLVQPARVLADCEANRAIVEAYQQRWREADEAADARNQSLHSMFASQATGLHTAVMAIAEVYAAHPDYREEWLA